MTINAYEQYQSRETSYRGRNTTQTRTFFCEWDGSGDNDEDAVIDAVEAVIPSSVTIQGQVLNYRQHNVSILVDEDKWMDEVQYYSEDSSASNRNSPPQAQDPIQNLTPNSLDEYERLDWSGEQTTKFTADKQWYITSDGAGRAVYNETNFRTIEYDGEQVKGVTVQQPLATYSITKAYTLPVNESQKTAFQQWYSKWVDRYGSVNKNRFRAFPEYCVRFDQLSLSTRDDGVLLVDFSWTYRPPQKKEIPYSSNLSTGETFYAKGIVAGFDYVWTLYQETIPTAASLAEDNDRVFLLPKTTYVSRVYPEAEFFDSDFQQTW